MPDPYVEPPHALTPPRLPDAIDRETLDSMPIVPCLVYVDNQRNRYEFRTHAGTLTNLRGMDVRDRYMLRGMLNWMNLCLDEVGAE